MNSTSSKKARFGALLLSALLVFPHMALAQNVENKPSAGKMAADLIIVRPLLAATTVIGTALYVVSLPFTIPGNNAKAAGRELVAKPGMATFVRCLGCEKGNYPEKQDD